MNQQDSEVVKNDAIRTTEIGGMTAFEPVPPPNAFELVALMKGGPLNGQTQVMTINRDSWNAGATLQRIFIMHTPIRGHDGANYSILYKSKPGSMVAHMVSIEFAGFGTPSAHHEPLEPIHSTVFRDVTVSVSLLPPSLVGREKFSVIAINPMVPIGWEKGQAILNRPSYFDTLEDAMKHHDWLVSICERKSD